MPIYGTDFAAIYNVRWAFFGSKMWPYLSRRVQRHHRGATSWLDLCCGAGSLLEYVCTAGFEATGVDASAAQLCHARENAPGARLIRGDVRRLDLGQRFDVVTCLFDSLNYLTERRDLGRVFRRVRRHLAPAGLFAFDMNTFEGLQDRWRGDANTIRERDYLLIVESSFNAPHARGTCLITGFLKEGRHYRRFDERHEQRGYRAAEIEAELGRAGLSFRRLDGETLGRVRRRSPRLLYLCGHARAARGAHHG